MKKVLLQEAIKLNKNRQRKKRWQKFVRSMAAVVVFCTTYALILPAITMEKVPNCGLEAHQHVQECYAQRQVRVLQCAVLDHSHDESCMDELGNYLCGYGTYVIHAHDDNCYDDQGKRICQLEEIEGHLHNEDCYVQIGPCQLEEALPHRHGEECYGINPILICGEEEYEAHTHDESCLRDVTELICGQKEGPGHVHGEACWQEILELTCPLEETEGHTHSEACMQERTELVCSQPQIDVHLHTEDCLGENGEVCCGIYQAICHNHSEACFVTSDELEEYLVCGMQEHIHEDACYPPEEKEDGTFLCGFSEHTHTELCMSEDGTESCNVPEHRHGAACVLVGYDPDADVETQEAWEATLRRVVLTGNRATDVAAIADSQLGYRESALNCVLEEDGSLSGYTRYGQWAGDPYGDWNAVFASFCLHYAQVDLPLADDCNSWIWALKAEELYQPSHSYMPKEGDLVFLDGDYNDNGEDRVGVVSWIEPETVDAPAQIHVIEGDVSGEVCCVAYELNAPVILGYGTISEQTNDEQYTCGMEPHEHEQLCFGEDGTLVCVKPEHVHSKLCEKRIVTYSDNTLRAELSLHGDQLYPEDLQLQVKQVTAQYDPETYYAMYLALENELDNSPYFMGDVSFYEMQLFSQGQRYQLPDGATTQVEVTFAQPVFSSDLVADAARLDTFALTEGEGAAPIAWMSVMGNEDDLAAQQSYQASAVSENAYENSEDGITGVSFLAEGATSFAVALSNSTVTGSFWERVESVSELNTYDTYMIVSVEGNYALRGNANRNYTQVAVDMVKGNPGYYTISDPSGAAVNDSTLQWSITPSGSSSSYKIRCNGTSSYLNFGSDSVISSSTFDVRMSYSADQTAWRMNGSVRSGWWNTTYYLNNAGGSYGRSTSTAPSTDFLIFKLSDVTELSVPDDVAANTGGGESAEKPTKPDYPDYITESPGMTGETQVGEIQGSYYSDPATTQLEAEFTGASADNGKVLSDKTVIYGNDDYNAFDSYAPNTFGVTLSALGQEFLVETIDRIVTPVDVVFVLDVSGSMEDIVSGETRTSAMVRAVNTSISEIMSNNSENRVGVVLFSGGAWDFLELDRYSATDGNYLAVEKRTISHTNDGYTHRKTIDVVSTGTKLTYEDGGSVPEPSTGPGWGTYTQAGIALGARMLEEVTNTSYTQVIGSGADQRSYTVQRQPVIILLSDGEPTYSTSNYKDILSGPHYGDGQATSGASGNNKGIHGYNTILSANYYKRMVGIHYEKPALFYTVGMGISAEGTGDLSGLTNTGDNYKRAVLNPTSSVITGLSGGYNAQYTTDMLRQLMLGTYSGSSVTVTSNWTDAWTGDPHTNIPVVENPYSNYSYADGAYFGEIGKTELDKIFGEILTNSLKINQYGFILRGHSSIELIDPIGEGMEIKGAPVLRYGGQNYTHTSTQVAGNVVTYIYNYEYVATDGSQTKANLSEIRVQVETDENGLQTVTMAVPDTALPSYAPHLSGEFYYEALPVRLIYQVGLTEQAEAEVLALKGVGGSKTYYTNRWQDGIGAVSEFKPTDDNPFYIEGTGGYREHHTEKSDNLTQTDSQVVTCHRDTTVYGGENVTLIIHDLGNNGKLVFEEECTLINIPVEKQWDASISEDDWQPVTVNLYRVTEHVEWLQAVTLNSENNWQAVFLDLPILESGYYAVGEEVLPGFLASYSDLTERIQVGDHFVTVVYIDAATSGDAQTIVITNSTGYELPETGGTGTHYHTFGGLLLIVAVLMYEYNQRRKRQREVCTSESS